MIEDTLARRDLSDRLIDRSLPALCRGAGGASEQIALPALAVSPRFFVTPADVEPIDRAAVVPILTLMIG